MTYGCNLNCSECFQLDDKKKHPPRQVIDKIIDEIESRFKDTCLVKITGGEVFSIPNFIKLITPKIALESTFPITITSNFTFPLSNYCQFIKLINHRLNRISFSWHHQYIPAEAFMRKIKVVRKFMNEMGLEKTPIKINLILIPHNFKYLKLFKSKLGNYKNILLHFQLFRIGKYGRKFYQYSDRELKVMSSLIADRSPLGFNNKRHYQGKLCRAGLNYFVVNPDGGVFTCHEAYEIGRNGANSLGNLVEGSFSPLIKAEYCPFDYCTVPEVALRHIVDR